MINRRSFAVAVAFAGLAAGGCGGEPTGTISGKVTLNGKPVTAGTINFLVGGVSFGSPINADGNYIVENVPVGDAIVLLADPPQEEAVSMPTRKPTEAEARSQKGPPPAPPKKPPVIPTKYGDQVEALFKFKVKGGDNTFNAEMK
jgi:hypothetical protein